MLNNITLVGYLAHDPDLRATVPDGKSICRFTIANTRPKTATKEREVDFIDIVTKNKTADFVNKWFKKGDPISLVGRLQTYVYVEKDGRSKKTYEVHASSVDFVPKMKEPLNEESPF